MNFRKFILVEHQKWLGGLCAVAAWTVRACAKSITVPRFLWDLLPIFVWLAREPTCNGSKPPPLYRWRGTSGWTSNNLYNQFYLSFLPYELGVDLVYASSTSNLHLSSALRRLEASWVACRPMSNNDTKTSWVKRKRISCHTRWIVTRILSNMERSRSHLLYLCFKSPM
jgi:hypothetical protein